MKQIKLILMCLGMITTLIACKKDANLLSSDVEQDDIYVGYEVFYDLDSNITMTSALFSSQSEQKFILLHQEAFVSFNEDILPNNGSSWRYLYEKKYTGLVSGIFEYQDIDNNIYQNNAPTPNAITFSTNIDTLSHTQEHVFTWEGTPLEENEIISFSYPTEFGTASMQIVPEDTENTTFKIYPGLIDKIPLGKAEFVFERQQIISDINGTSVGGEVRTIYKTTPKEVFITE